MNWSTGQQIGNNKKLVENLPVYHSMDKLSRRQTDFFFFFFFLQKTGFDILCELSPWETICMKCRSLFSGKSKKILSNGHLLKFLASMQCVSFLNI